ncbi:MAG TPA: hypothetical protein PK228_09480 [Saprospiraceae bacterium]|nr:hypothetical protein [Saprospiraceae bacterium]
MAVWQIKKTAFIQVQKTGNGQKAAPGAHQIKGEQFTTNIIKQHQIMNYVLICETGFPYETDIEIKEFNTLKEMTDFINKSIRSLAHEEIFEIKAAYEIRKKIEYEQVQFVTKYQPKEI